MNFTKLNQIIERNNQSKKPMIKKTIIMRVDDREYKFKNTFYKLHEEPKIDYKKREIEYESSESDSESEIERLEDEEEDQESSDESDNDSDEE